MVARGRGRCRRRSSRTSSARTAGCRRPTCAPSARWRRSCCAPGSCRPARYGRRMPSRRSNITMTDDEVVAYLEEQKVLNVATIGPSGHPHVVAMWYVVLDGKPAFWTFGKSQKVMNIRRDPKITGLVESGETYDQLRGVELVGTARLLEDYDDDPRPRRARARRSTPARRATPRCRSSRSRRRSASASSSTSSASSAGTTRSSAAPTDDSGRVAGGANRSGRGRAAFTLSTLLRNKRETGPSYCPPRPNVNRGRQGMRRRARAYFGALAVLTLVAAACGGDDDDDAGTASEPTSAATDAPAGDDRRDDGRGHRARGDRARRAPSRRGPPRPAAARRRSRRAHRRPRATASRSASCTR